MSRPHLRPISLESLLVSVGLDQTQARQLVGLAVGTTPLLSVEDRPGIYQLVSLIDQLGWTDGLAYVQSQLTDPNLTVSQAMANIINNSPLMSKAKDRMMLDMDRYRRKVTSGKGLHTCRGCGSKETVSVQKQLRSADEPMTTIITCTECGRTWRE